MGIFRLYLAALVVIQHLGGGERTFHDIGGMAGQVAVFSFYVLSGYLIARVVKTTYSDGIRGLRAFAVNRFLRIYPTYWFLVLFSLGVVSALPAYAVQLNDALRLPDTLLDGIAQISIFGLHKVFYLNTSRLIPTGWSLNVELIYYIINAAILGRTRKMATLWWLGSLALALIYAITNDGHAAYFTIWGPSICFSSGAMLAHYDNGWLEGPRAPILRLLPFAGISVLAFAHDLRLPVPEIVVLYITIPMTVFAIAMLEPKWRSAGLYRADKIMADMSYPLFLCHWPVAVLVSHFLLADANAGPLLLATVLPIATALSWLVTTIVETPIRGLRARIRNSARHPRQQDAALPAAEGAEA